MTTVANLPKSDLLTNSKTCAENGLVTMKRKAGRRIFVNRSLSLSNIRFYGFDMDYTLAEYCSPQFEAMVFQLLINRLVDIGYPSEIKDFNYDKNWPVRGLWFDKHFGKLLKVDAYGNILFALHGFTRLKPREVEQIYPNRFLAFSSDRIYILNTLFELPECYALACLVSLMDRIGRETQSTGVRYKDVFMSYRSMFQDVRASCDYVHIQGDMKSLTVANPEKYIKKDNRLIELMARLRQHGAKTFILTNSPFNYVNSVMSYIMGQDWRKYFNYVVVDSGKPKWFQEGTIFRQVDVSTGAVRIGSHLGPLREGQVYSGGSCEQFNELVGARGRDVLYVGDHVFGDVLKSKKARGWHTMLIIPELTDELRVWTDKHRLFEELHELELELQIMCRNLDSETVKDPPAVIDLRQKLAQHVAEMDQQYGVLGSLFRYGSRLTFFASQMQRYADLYAASCIHLLYYPLFYMYLAPPMLMPHESTVSQQSEPFDVPLRRTPSVQVPASGSDFDDIASSSSSPRVNEMDLHYNTNLIPLEEQIESVIGTDLEDGD